MPHDDQRSAIGYQLSAVDYRVRMAIDLGVDSLEYIDRSTAPGYPPDIIASLKSRGRSMFLVPPIGYYRRYVSFRSDVSVLDSDRLTEFMTEPVGRAMLDDLRLQRSRVRGRGQVDWTLASSARR
ncbi:MAG: hypothetical protein ACRD2A_11690 [Vicinamibacterales bacterium]